MKGITYSVSYFIHALRRSSLGVLSVAALVSTLLLALCPLAQAQGSGTIWVSEFAPDKVRSFPLDGSSGTTFSITNATGVAFNAAGDLFMVSDTPTGTTTSTIWMSPGGTGTPVAWFTGDIGKPHGIAFDASQNMLVATANNSSANGATGIQRIVLRNGVLTAKPFGVSSSVLIKPFGVAVDSQGNVFVTDGNGDGNGNPGSGAIVKFNSTGMLHSVFAQNLITYNVPYGIAIDGANNVYITNQAGNTMYMFDSTGTTATQLIPSQPFNSPLGITIDGSGNVYVANQNTNPGNIWEFLSGGTNMKFTDTDPKPHFLAFQP